MTEPTTPAAYRQRSAPTVHGEASIEQTMARRRRMGRPEGECGTCDPNHCPDEDGCIHGFALAQRRRWRSDNPEWGRGRA